MVRGDPPVRWANTASISGSITAFARRSGSSRAQARTCNKRTASGDNRRELAYQAINARPLPFFDATATFEALMIVLHQPATPIPPDPLPGLCKRGGGHRGHQDPFQWLLAARRACSSQTRMTHTVRGSLPARGSWRGGKSVNCPQASWSWVERAWCPCRAGTSNGRLAWLGQDRACVSQ